MKDSPVRPGLIDILGIAALVGLVSRAGGLAGDPGIGWHLRSGQHIAETWKVPGPDLFLMGAQPRAWLHNQWLSDLIFWVVYRAGGWPFLEVFAYGIGLCLLLGVLAPAIRKRGCIEISVFLSLFLTMSLVGIQWFLRPVLFSFLLFGILFRIVMLWYERRVHVTRLAWIPFLFLLWANLHPGFAIGFVFCACIGLSILIDRSLGRRRIRMAREFGLTVALSVLATMVNPYGWTLHREILRLVGDPFFMNLNVEWLSPDFHDALFAPFALVIVMLILLGASSSRNVLTMADLTVTAIFVFLGLSSRRYIPFCGIVCSLSLAKLLQDLILNRYGSLFRSALSRRPFAAGGWAAMVYLVLVLFVLVSGAIPGRTAADSGPDAHFPKAAVDELVRLRRSSGRHELRIFSTPDWGGYLTWRLWPWSRVFVDDRNELNGRAHYEEYRTLCKMQEGWKELLQRYQFEALLLPSNCALASNLEGLPDWEPVFQDKDSRLYLRRGAP